MAKYAWTVDHTMTLDLEDENRLVEDTDNSANGTTGPHDAPPELLDRLARGEGRRWRTLYDADYDGQPQDLLVCHAGRYLDWTDLESADTGDAASDTELGFGPLDDLSRPDSGAVTIQYEDKHGKWVTL